MPVIINNMPSGAVQYPIVTGPNQAQINAANMFGFVNQNPNKESDMAAMLALVQLLSQQKNIDLQREFGRDELALRREEMGARQSENALDRTLRREEMQDLRTQTQRQMDLLLKQLTGEQDARKQQFDLLSVQMKQSNLVTGAQLEQMKMNNQLAARTEARDYANAAAQSQLAAAEAGIQSRQQQAQAEVTKGTLAGITAQQSNQSTPLTEAMGKVATGSAKTADYSKMSDNLIPETRSIVEQAKALGQSDPATAMAMLAKQRERIGQVRASISDNDNLWGTDWRRNPTQVLRDWWTGSNSMVEKRKQVLSSVADQAELYLTRAAKDAGVPIPAAASPEAIQAQIAPEMIRKSAEDRAAALRNAEVQRTALWKAITSPNANFQSIVGALIGGSGQNAVASPPAIQIPQTQPSATSAPDEWSPFMQGLRR